MPFRALSKHLTTLHEQFPTLSDGDCIIELARLQSGIERMRTALAAIPPDGEIPHSILQYIPIEIAGEINTEGFVANSIATIYEWIKKALIWFQKVIEIVVRGYREGRADSIAAYRQLMEQAVIKLRAAKDSKVANLEILAGWHYTDYERVSDVVDLTDTCRTEILDYGRAEDATLAVQFLANMYVHAKTLGAAGAATQLSAATSPIIPGGSIGQIVIPDLPDQEHNKLLRQLGWSRAMLLNETSGLMDRRRERLSPVDAYRDIIARWVRGEIARVDQYRLDNSILTDQREQANRMRDHITKLSNDATTNIKLFIDFLKLRDTMVITMLQDVNELL